MNVPLNGFSYCLQMWYFKFGLDSTFSESAPLQQKGVKVYVDDRELALPDGLENVLIVNLPSMYGGKFLWMDREDVKVLINEIW